MTTPLVGKISQSVILLAELGYVMKRFYFEKSPSLRLTRKVEIDELTVRAMTVLPEDTTPPLVRIATGCISKGDTPDEFTVRLLAVLLAEYFVGAESIQMSDLIRISMLGGTSLAELRLTLAELQASDFVVQSERNWLKLNPEFISGVLSLPSRYRVERNFLVDSKIFNPENDEL